MPGSFRVLDASRPEEAAEWLASWNAWPEREVFAHPGYLGLYTSPACRALCANWRSESGAVLYPFLIRDLTVERFWPGGMPQAFDITTPYGYGGAFVLGPRNPPDSESFWCAFDAWASDHSVVSEFIRFSLFDQSLLAYPGTRKRRQDNVIRNLNLIPMPFGWISNTRCERTLSAPGPMRYPSILIRAAKASMNSSRFIRALWTAGVQEVRITF